MVVMVRLLSATIAGSFHLLIFPERIPANVSVESVTGLLEPGRLVKIATGQSTVGTWISLGIIGEWAESEKAKSTVPFAKAVLPAPDPTEP